MGTVLSIIDKPISAKIAHKKFRTEIDLWCYIYSSGMDTRTTSSIRPKPPYTLYFGPEYDSIKLNKGTILIVCDVVIHSNFETGSHTEVIVGFTDPRDGTISVRSRIMVPEPLRNRGEKYTDETSLFYITSSHLEDETQTVEYNTETLTLVKPTDQ